MEKRLLKHPTKAKVFSIDLISVNVNLTSTHELEIGYFYDIVGRVDQDLGVSEMQCGCFGFVYWVNIVGLLWI
jgi:hypothetical protein